MISADLGKCGKHQIMGGCFNYSPFKKTISKFSCNVLSYMHDIAIPTKDL